MGFKYFYTKMNLALFFFNLRSIKNDTERAPTCWFTLQIPTVAGAGSGLEPGTQSMYST